MRIDQAALVVHVGAGAAALLLGPLALWFAGSGDRARPLLTAYHGAVLVTVGTSVVLIGASPSRLWWLAPVAALTVALVAVAHGAGPITSPARLRLRLHARGGVYIALVTATLVVAVDGPAQVLAWVLPTAVGFWLIERWYRRAVDRHASRGSAPSGRDP